MLLVCKTTVLLGAFWAAGALAWQVRVARGGGRRDYAQPTGSPGRGLLYSFTGAMLPAHKESIRLHPVEFGVGLVMHAGMAVSFVVVAGLLAWPGGAERFMATARILAGVALLAGLALFVRRLASPMLRSISVPDDYLANLATCGLTAGAAFLPLHHSVGQMVLLAYTALLLIYVPLGKLRHAVFFFIARGDYGRRLGYRGVYPPAAEGK